MNLAHLWGPPWDVLPDLALSNADGIEHLPALALVPVRWREHIFSGTAKRKHGLVEIMQSISREVGTCELLHPVHVVLDLVTGRRVLEMRLVARVVSRDHAVGAQGVLIRNGVLVRGCEVPTELLEDGALGRLVQDDGRA